ncbi:hypothetical protein BDV93DRAFT_592544 [Ceratobasidium sp. AG-I]|nr:hypothetical protein BDV93DRAFT_592544 [Ceratobasidium sp. AG-I]
MKFAISTILVAAASVALALPARRADPPVEVNDISILNVALTLENIESAFYQSGLSKYDAKAFEKAGFEPWVRGRFQQIADHEATHVKFLEGALGNQATKPCSYSFPYTSVRSFVELSMVLEGVGVSAYLGAAHLISNKDYLTAAAAILTTETRHAAWVGSAALKGTPWSGAFDTPITFDQAHTMAVGFITSCPSTNPPLPVEQFPALTVKTASYKAGDTVSILFDEARANGAKTYVSFLSGLTQTVIPVTGSGKSQKVKIPAGLMGTVYAVVTTSDKAVTDENTVAGPTVLMFPFTSSARQNV